MTVREWFRVQRGEMWRLDAGPRNYTFAADLDAVAAACTVGAFPPEVEFRRVGPYVRVEDIAAYVAHEQLMASVRRQMDDAVDRLLARIASE